MRWLPGVALGLEIALAAVVGSPSGAAERSPAKIVAAWVTETGDSKGAPFAIVDKVGAQVSVFDADGTPRGSAPALLGLARGDVSTSGIGDRPLAQILPGERTTPAGRFVAEFGINAAGRPILWVDYADAVSLHAVVVGQPKERRLERLATPSPADNRISYGCINVPTAFFAGTIEPVFRRRGGIVYVLPEERSIHELFGIRLTAVDASDRHPDPSRQ